RRRPEAGGAGRAAGPAGAGPLAADPAADPQGAGRDRGPGGAAGRGVGPHPHRRGQRRSGGPGAAVLGRGGAAGHGRRAVVTRAGGDRAAATVAKREGGTVTERKGQPVAERGGQTVTGPGRQTATGSGGQPVADREDDRPVPAFQVRIAVRGYELDPNGHVNQAVYLQYAEHARWEYLRTAGITQDGLLAAGVGPVALE